MRVSYLYTILLLLSGFSAHGQDIHWSQLNRQPLYQNPGNTGLFNGDLRLTGNYKDQWRSVTVPFSTIAIAADAKPISKKFSAGFLFFHDQVGDGKMRTVELQISIAKQFKITPDSIHCISAGIQTGLNYRAFDATKFYFDNQFDGIVFDPNLPTGENFPSTSISRLLASAGVVYTWTPKKGEQLTVGLSGFNLNSPKASYFGDNVRLDPRMNLFGIYERPLNSDWSILPGISFNLQGKYRELLLGGQARYTLINKLGTYRAVDGGIWFRNRDAVILRAGLAMQNWTIGVSYDTNISSLIPASNLRGGLELSASLILARFKPAKVIHRICPDYI